MYTNFLSYGLTQLNVNTRNLNIIELILTNNTKFTYNITYLSVFEFDEHVSDQFTIYSDLMIPKSI